MADLVNPVKCVHRVPDDTPGPVVSHDGVTTLKSAKTDTVLKERKLKCQETARLSLRVGGDVQSPRHGHPIHGKQN